MIEKFEQVQQLPLDLLLWPSLKFGAFSGSAGLLLLTPFGLARSAHPALFAIISTAQCFTLGSTYWLARSSILNYHLFTSTPLTTASTPHDRLIASTIAGSISGATTGALFRGRSNIIPGVIMFGVFGAAGQKVFERMDENHTAEAERGLGGEEEESWWKRAVGSKWSPMKVLTDEEYESMLKERLLRAEAEIAVLDEDIARLKEEGKVEQGKGKGNVER